MLIYVLIVIAASVPNPQRRRVKMAHLMVPISIHRVIFMVELVGLINYPAYLIMQLVEGHI